jgi:hypothetical protein
MNNVVKEECIVQSCNKPMLAKGYCNKHYKQIRAHGKIGRTKYDPNEINITTDRAEIKLYNSKGEEIALCLIDIEDVDVIKNHKWCYKDGYAITKKDGRTTAMHRLIMNPLDNMVVDHVNHNTLDNRKSNLRVCTAKENNRNLSNVEGVYYRKTRKSWKAKITVDGKSIYLGTYKTKSEAKRARRIGEIKYFGEFAPVRSDAI